MSEPVGPDNLGAGAMSSGTSEWSKLGHWKQLERVLRRINQDDGSESEHCLAKEIERLNGNVFISNCPEAPVVLITDQLYDSQKRVKKLERALNRIGCLRTNLQDIGQCAVSTPLDLCVVCAALSKSQAKK